MATRNLDAERKIYFYRAISHNRDNDEVVLDRKAICASISALQWTSDFYLDDGEDQITCAEVVNSNAPQQIKLYGIRRENLPALDDGAGAITELSIQEHQGLAEAVHIRLYPNNVVAIEFFYYGPRAKRFQRFLNARCDQRVVLYELVRHDMIERALKFRDIRVLRAKIHPSSITKARAAELGIQGLINTAKNFDAGVYADLTLRAERHDLGFTTKVKQMLRRFQTASESPAGIFENLEIEGVNPESGHVEALNLLSDQLGRSPALLTSVDKGTRSALYVSLTATSGALLGFAITAVTVLLALGGGRRLDWLYEQDDFIYVRTIFLGAIRALAVGTIWFSVLVVIDTSDRSRKILEGLGAFVLTLVLPRLGELIRLLSDLLWLSIKDRTKLADPNPPFREPVDEAE